MGLVFSSVFLFLPDATANNGLNAEVWDILGQNNAPVLPDGLQPIVTTTVANIDFNWGGGSVLGGPSEDVMVRFTGSIISPVTQNISFLATADDGTKLYLDGVLITNDWRDKGGGGTVSDPIAFTANVPKQITLWYYENGGGAAVNLYWDQSGQMEIIPASAFSSTPPAPPEVLSIGAPTNLTAIDSGTAVILSWSAPTDGNRQPERYAISFTTEGQNGWGIATGNVGDANALNTTITINYSLLDSLMPRGTTWSFHIRSDNDTLALYSANSNTVTLKVGKTAQEVAAEAAAVQAAIDAENARLAAIAAEEARVAEEARLAEVARLAEIARLEAVAEAARLAAIKAEEERIAAEEAAARAEEEARQAEEERIAAEEAAAKAEQERLEAEAEAARQAEEEARAEAERLEAEAEAAREAEEKAKAEEEAARQAEEDAKAEAEAKELEEARNEEEKAEEELEDIAEKAKDGEELTEEETELVVESLLEDLQEGEALSASEIQASGISYSDLPPATPVDVRTDENGNAVVITAEVAAQIELLENPTELFATALSDPGAALAALGSIGADMSEEERKEATDMVVATVVAAGAAINAAAVATGGATGGGSSGGGGGSGGGSGSNSPGSRGGRRW